MNQILVRERLTSAPIIRPLKPALCALIVALGASTALAGDSQPLRLPSATQASQHGAPEVSPSTHSVARLWNEQLLEAIRSDTPRPTVHSRNLFQVSAAKYDAWAAYSEVDQAVFHAENLQAADVAASREIAISYAAYRLLSHRFAVSPGQPATQQRFDDLMDLLGLDRNDQTIVGDSPAALGNRIAETLIAHGLTDGSNQSGNYQDTTGYNPTNVPMAVAFPGTGGLSNPDAWQPLIPPGAFGSQNFLSPHWRLVQPFALVRPGVGALYFDPGEPPTIEGPDQSILRQDVLELIRASASLDPMDGQFIEISPAVMGNNPLGTNDGTGYPLNPATGAPYPPNSARKGDWSRVLAEFWADGPQSSTPPGHWNEIANSVTEYLGDDKRLFGSELVDDLEWDIKLYLTLNGAAHDVAITTWEIKRHYNAARPITLIRGMAEFGQSSDPDLPSYDPRGLPLEAGLVEIITDQTSAAGQHHEHLADHLGEVAIRAWRGHPELPEGIGGVGWIRAIEWLPYQAANFVTPPFGGYTSGHSAFSRASAEVLAAYTGDEFFPGGLGEYIVSADGEFGLGFEHGPQEPVQLQWARYYDAADEAGLSRIYGGIHPAFDDFPSRIIGHHVGVLAVERARALFSAPASEHSTPISVRVMPPWTWLLLVAALIITARIHSSRSLS